MSVGMSYELAFAAPGIRAAVETTENILWWGRYEQLRLKGAILNGAMRDLKNSPTDVVRQGMILGKITATGKLTAWDPNAYDGTENIYGVLMIDQKMTVNSTSTDRFCGPIMVGGPIKAGGLFRSNATYGDPGLFTTDPYEQLARLKMTQDGRFWFDDEEGYVPNFGFARVKSLADVGTANAYTVLVGDNGTLFTNTGCTVSQTITLPGLTATPASAENSVGFHVQFYMTAAYDIVIAAAAGSTIYSAGVAGGASVTVTGAVGTMIDVYGVFDKTAAKWLLYINSGTVTVYGGNAGVLEAVTAAGTTYADAGAIAATTTIAQVTCDSTAKGVVLPVATYVNQRITLRGGASNAHVYLLNNTATINGTAGQTGISLAATKTFDAICITLANGGSWITTPITAS